MAVDKLYVAQRACILNRVTPITSFTDGSTQAQVLELMYEDIVETELVDVPWNFCKTFRELSRDLTAPLETAWDASYAVPTDILGVYAVRVNGYNIEYDIVDDKIHCNAGENDTLILEGCFRAHEQKWSSDFRLLVIYRLAEIVARSVTRKDSQAADWKTVADGLSERAKTRHAQSKTTKHIVSRSFLSARRGYRNRLRTRSNTT